MTNGQMPKFFAPILLNNRFPALHGLRVLAMLAIIFFHTVRFHWRVAYGAWFAMDAFFVLSGFLIGHILLHAANLSGRSVARFYWRRAFRIFPAYYFVLGGAALVIGRVAPDRLSDIWGELLFLTNYRMTDRHLMNWAWSLCVEEHFYVLCPFVLVLLKKVESHQYRLGLLFLLWLSAIVARIATFRAIAPPLDVIKFDHELYVLTHCRYDELVAGIMAAYLNYNFSARLVRFFAPRKVQWMALGVISLCAVTLFFLPIVFTTDNPQLIFAAAIFFPTVASIFYGVGILYLVSREGPTSRFLGHPSFLLIASISYPVYLVHLYVYEHLIPRLHFAGTAGPFGVELGFLFTVIISVTIAYGIHIFLEKPLLNFRDR